MAVPTRGEIIDAYGDVVVSAGSLSIPLSRIVEAESLCPVPQAEREPVADARYLLGKVAGTGYPLLAQHAEFLSQPTTAG